MFEFRNIFGGCDKVRLRLESKFNRSEIDVSHFVRLKYNQGHAANLFASVGIFDIYQSDVQSSVLVLNSRDADTVMF